MKPLNVYVYQSGGVAYYLPARDVDGWQLVHLGGAPGFLERDLSKFKFLADLHGLVIMIVDKPESKLRDE